MILPARIASGEHGRVFKPPSVPMSASRMKDVVNVSMLVKKRITHNDAAATSGRAVPAVPIPNAKLQMRIEPNENVSIEIIS